MWGRPRSRRRRCRQRPSCASKNAAHPLEATARQVACLPEVLVEEMEMALMVDVTDLVVAVTDRQCPRDDRTTTHHPGDHATCLTALDPLVAQGTRVVEETEVAMTQQGRPALQRQRTTRTSTW